MDIIIEILSKKYLEANIEEFIDISSSEKYEYWNVNNFIKDLPEKYALSLYACEGNKLIGYIIASQKGENAYIHKFMVHPDFRKKSIGMNLQRHFEERISFLKLKNILLSVVKDNDKGIEFYRKNDFEFFGERLDSINDIGLYIMKKKML